MNLNELRDKAYRIANNETMDANQLDIRLPQLIQ